MKFFNHLLLCLVVFAFPGLHAQIVDLEGYTFELDNRGYLEAVKVTILESKTKTLVTTLTTNEEGFFKSELVANRTYEYKAELDGFHPSEGEIKTSNEKCFLNIKLNRKAGYLLDLTLAEKKPSQQTDAIIGAQLEMYNNNTRSQEVAILEHPDPAYTFKLKQGNHYTILVRKPGYFNKRIEAFVNVKDCILCIDGVKELEPGVSDNLTRGFEMGTLLANLDMERADSGYTVVLKNTFAYNSAEIGPETAKELDKLSLLLRENPVLIVELGCHTDARGSDPFNLNLSKERAEAAVEYLIEYGGIAPDRLVARGYGETQLLNQCENWVKCLEEEHEVNRRTVLTVIGHRDNDPYASLDLTQILEREANILEVQNSEVIQVQSIDELPPEIRRQIEEQEARRKNNEQVPSFSDEFPDRQSLPDTIIPRYHSIPEDVDEDFDEFFDPNEVEETEEGAQTTPKEYSVIQPAIQNLAPETEVTAEQKPKEVDYLPANYSGYKIEIMTASKRLPEDHDLFFSFGSLLMEIKPDGNVAYLLGNFEHLEDAEDFVENFLSDQYSESPVVKYIHGRRDE